MTAAQVKTKTKPSHIKIDPVIEDVAFSKSTFSDIFGKYLWV